MRHGRMARGRKKGPAKKRRMTSFLNACFLLQLQNKDLHGYELMLGLENFISNSEEYDPSITYRIMRDMEDAGWVESYEGTISRGPRRRMYSLTPAGRRQLAHLMKELEKARNEIDNLLTFYTTRQGGDKR